MSRDNELVKTSFILTVLPHYNADLSGKELAKKNRVITGNWENSTGHDTATIRPQYGFYEVGFWTSIMVTHWPIVR